MNVSKATAARYLPGTPSAYTDLIHRRRIQILEEEPGFLGKGGAILDVGCGNGASLLLLAAHFEHCHGIDLSEHCLQTFEQQLQARSIQHCTMECADIEQEFGEADSFDRLISFEVLEHVGDDIALAQRMLRCLKPGGVLAVSVPNKWWIFETHGAYLPLLRWNRVPFLSWLPQSLHRRIARARNYKKSDILGVLRQAGLEVVNLHYITAPMDRLRPPRLQSLARRWFFGSSTTSVPFLATSILVIARKPE